MTQPKEPMKCKHCYVPRPECYGVMCPATLNKTPHDFSVPEKEYRCKCGCGGNNCYLRHCDENCSKYNTPTPNSVENWERTFVKKFYVYNLETNTPAGAEKEAIAFIKDLLDQKEGEIEKKQRKELDNLFFMWRGNAKVVDLDDVHGALWGDIPEKLR